MIKKMNIYRKDAKHAKRNLLSHISHTLILSDLCAPVWLFLLCYVFIQRV